MITGLCFSGIVFGLVLVMLHRLNSQPTLREPLPIVCRNCGARSANPAVREKGSNWLEVLLWALNFLVAAVYTFWRSSAPLEGTCPACGSPDVIPVPAPEPLAHPGR